MVKITFEGTENQITNLKHLIEFGDNDLPKEINSRFSSKFYPVTFKNFKSFYFWALAIVDDEFIRVEADNSDNVQFFGVYGVTESGVSQIIADLETEEEAENFIKMINSII